MELTIPDTALAGRENTRMAHTVDLEDLARAAAAGESCAADRLYAEVRPALLRVALAMGVQPDSAADLVQETLWRAHDHIARFDPARASFMGWITVILTRRVGNRRRDLGRRFRFLERWRTGRSSADRTGQRAIEARLTLSRLLEGLTGRQRQVVALYEIGGLSADETATALGITASGVRSIARDARNRLRDLATSATVHAVARERRS